MKCDSRALLLVHSFASPCLGHEPKAKVTTIYVLVPQAIGVMHDLSHGSQCSYVSSYIVDFDVGLLQSRSTNMP
jgi:hypothetical protein